MSYLKLWTKPWETTGAHGGPRPKNDQKVAGQQTNPLPKPPGPLKLRLFGEIYNNKNKKKTKKNIYERCSIPITEKFNIAF